MQGSDKIGVRVGRYINKFKVAKLFEINITENSFSYQRKQEVIAEEEALDGVYIICFLAYYVEWRMREALAPILFEEVDNDLINTSNLFQYKPSSEVKKKTGSKRTSDGLPVNTA